MNAYSIFKASRIINKEYPYQKYTNLLSQRHPRLKGLIKRIGPIYYAIPIWTSISDAVLYATVGQMLSISAASSIIKKLLDEFGTSAKVISWASRSFEKSGPEKGLSQRKRKTLAEWSRHIKKAEKKSSKWTTMPIEEYRQDIMKIWGMGPWSADMIAIFHLGRMDVWPIQDAGIQRACEVIFNTRDTVRVKKYVSGCETVASLYLWEMLNQRISSEFTSRLHG